MGRRMDRVWRRTRSKAANRGMRLLSLVCMAIGMMTLSVSAYALEAGDKEKAPHLTFSDWSAGFPDKGQWRQGFAIHDVDGDGQLDLAATPRRMSDKGDDRPRVWYGDEQGKWREKRVEAPVSCDYGDMAIADFDRDGIPDMALAMHGMALTALKGKGKDQYVDMSNGLPPAKEFMSRAIVSADFNGDGVPDIAAVAENNFQPTYPNPFGLVVCLFMDGAWKCHPVGDRDAVRGLFADQLTVGDVNGDGNKDIAVGSLNNLRELIVWLGDGKGEFRVFNEGLPREHHYLSVGLGDINKDGKDDLLASVTGVGAQPFLGLKAFLSRPDKFEEVSDGLPTNEIFFTVAACDLTGDGIPEFIGGTADGGVRIFAYKEGRWERLTVSGLPEKGLKRMYNIRCADFNSDGRQDIAFNYAEGQSNTGGIRVFLNTPPK